MRPLTETIASSGGVKNPSQGASGVLPDSDSLRANGKQKQMSHPCTHNAFAATANNTPRRGTFSLQNGYGYPLNGHNSSYSSSSRSSSSGSSTQQSTNSKYARPVVYTSSTMDKSQLDYNTQNGHRTGNMSPVLANKTGPSQTTSTGLITTESYQPSHHQQHPYQNAGPMLDIQCHNNSEQVDSFYEDEFLSQRFYVHESPSPTDSQCTSLHSGAGSGDEEEEHPFFAGMRDVRHPETMKELKIISSKGTIRGVKNRVRAGIATFLNQGEEAKKVSDFWQQSINLETLICSSISRALSLCMHKTTFKDFK